MPGQLHPRHCVVRLVSYREGEAWRCGILDGDEVADAAGVAAAAGVSEDCSSTRAVLTGGERILEALASRVGEVEPTSVSELALGPPVPDPEKILCLGLSYRDHAEEVGAKAPPAPIVFAKFANSLIGPGQPIVRPAISDEIDYEAELAVVIGRRCRSVSEAQALDYVAGGMPFNDVSARPPDAYQPVDGRQGDRHVRAYQARARSRHRDRRPAIAPDRGAGERGPAAVRDHRGLIFSIAETIATIAVHDPRPGTSRPERRRAWDSLASPRFGCEPATASRSRSRALECSPTR